MFFSIQYLRAIAAIFVVLTHISHKLSVNSENVLGGFNIGEYGVDLFFIISGFIMCLTVQKKKITFLSFMKARCIRILPLYWILTTVALIIFLINPSLINASGGATSIWGSYTLIPNGSKLLINNGWTLSYEFFFYLIFASFLFIKEKQNITASIVLIFLVFLGFFNSSQIPLITFMTSPLLLEFIMGIFCYELIKRKMIQPKLAISLIILGLYIFHELNVNGPLETPLGRAFYAGIPMMMIFLGLVSIERLILKNKFFCELGASSYSLYLIHPFALSGVTVVLKTLGVNISNMPYLYLILMFIGSLFLGWICYKFIEIPIDNKIKFRTKLLINLLNTDKSFKAALKRTKQK